MVSVWPSKTRRSAPLSTSHSLMLLSLYGGTLRSNRPEPVKTYFPSGVKRTVLRGASCPSNLRISPASCRSQMTRVPSPALESACWPSEAITAFVGGIFAPVQATFTWWPCTCRRCAPISRSQSSTRPAQSAVSALLPSAESATLVIRPACPLSTCNSSPLSKSHRCRLESEPPVKARLPSGLMVMLKLS